MEKGLLGARKRVLTQLTKELERAKEQTDWQDLAGDLLQADVEGGVEFEGNPHLLTQAEILQGASDKIKEKLIERDMNLGPYGATCSRDGNFLLEFGRKGHLRMDNLRSLDRQCEFHVRETIRDATFLNDEALFAVAQKHDTFIYAKTSEEVHRLPQWYHISRLTFLPFHSLLVGSGENADLRYMDVTMGQEVALHRTKLGATQSLCQNPTSAVVALGHSIGKVTLWTPNMDKPALSMLTHRGPVSCCEFFRDILVTAGSDRKIRMWDLRMVSSSADRPFGGMLSAHDYQGAGRVSDLAISQTGILGVSFGKRVEFFPSSIFRADQTPPALINERLPEDVRSICFQPWRDFCFLGREAGISTFIVPGSGSAEVDTREINPFATKKQRREKLVRDLLEKLPADSIVLDPAAFGRLALPDEETEAANRLEKLVEAREKEKKKERANKKRGRGKDGRREKAKKEEFLQKTEEIRAERQRQRDIKREKEETSSSRKRKRDVEMDEETPDLPPALARFAC